MKCALICFVVLFASKLGATSPIEAKGTISLNKHYVLQYFSKVNWFLSFLSCERNGMRLATIDSKQEEDELNQLILNSGLKNEFFWIGAADLGHEGRFSWYSTGDLIKYSNFRAGQPDNYKNEEDCIELSYNGGWNDNRCSAEMYYVCKMIHTKTRNEFDSK